MDLHTTVSHTATHFRCKHFCTRRFSTYILACITTTCGIEHHTFCSIDFCFRVREHALNQLEISNRLTKLFTLDCILKRVVQHTGCSTDAELSNMNTALI